MMARRGVTGGTPASVNDPQFSTIQNSLKSLPTCWVREDLIFWELCLEPGKLSSTARLDAILTNMAGSGKKLQINVVPCPHPTFTEWQKRVGGAWADWFRPDWRLWESTKFSLQLCLDHVVRTWAKLGGKKENLRFEWFNEPATGHVSGGDIKREPKGTWNAQFHSFCNYLLTDGKAIDFHGHPVIGPTLSMFGQKEPEQIELQTCLGGDDGLWWTKMQRRCCNLGIYLPRAVRSGEEAAMLYRPQLERIISVMQKLPVPITSKSVCVHEWYVTKPMLGYHEGNCDDNLRADCIDAIGEVIGSYREIEFAFFFTHNFRNPSNSPYEEFGAFSGPARNAMIRYLANG
jgi:hypothetical protein